MTTRLPMMHMHVRAAQGDLQKAADVLEADQAGAIKRSTALGREETMKEKRLTEGRAALLEMRAKAFAKAEEIRAVGGSA